MKTNSKILTLTSMLLLSSFTHSGTMGAMGNPWRSIYSIGAGPIWGQQSSSQTIYLESDVFKTYDGQKVSTPALAGEIFAGLQRNINNCIGELGIVLAGVNNLKINGDIWEDADPDFNNYNYKYDIRHGRVALRGRLLTGIFPRWLGYISGAVGVGINNATNFTITPKIYQEVPAPEFTNNSIASFTYSLGLGLQTQLTGNWQFGIGYQFADLGKSELGRAAGQTINSGITLNNLYTHQLLFTLSYLCDGGSDYGYDNTW